MTKKKKKIDENSDPLMSLPVNCLNGYIGMIFIYEKLVKVSIRLNFLRIGKNRYW